MTKKLLRWCFFTVLFSLIPLVADYVMQCAKINGAASLSVIGRHGELYLLASAMAAVGVGELQGIHEKYEAAKVVATGTCLLILTLATILFALSAGAPEPPPIEPAKHAAEAVTNYVLRFSSLMFLFSCVASTSCIALSEAK